MGSKRAQKAKKRAKREARSQTRRAQNATSASTNEPQRQTRRKRRAPSTKSASTARIVESLLKIAPTPPPSPTCSEPTATLIAPAYVLQTIEDCWDCYQETAVFALAAEGMEIQTPSPSKIDRFVLMTSIEWLSPDLQQFLRKHSNSAFSLDPSTEDDGCRHYMNHCSHCGAPIDDRSLYETGSAFSPMYEDELEYITVIRLPEDVDLRISAKPGDGMSEWQSALRRP